MKNLSNAIIKHNIIIKIIIIISITIIFIQVQPIVSSFNYKYQLGKTWSYPTLEAPFNFPIYKTSEQISAERNNLTNNIKPYYIYNTSFTEKIINNFRTNLYEIKSLNHTQLANIDSLFTNIMHIGIIQLDEYISNKDSSYIVCVEHGVNAKYEYLGSLYTIITAKNYFKQYISSINTDIADKINKIATDNLFENITLDKNKTNLTIQKQLNNYSKTSGIINKGTIIVHNGDIVTDKIFNELNSLKVYYENNLHTFNTLQSYFITFILYIIIIFSFFIYLYIYNPELIISNRAFFIITLTISLIVLIAYFVENNFSNHISIIPIFIVPIILRAFFDYKTSLGGLLLTILLIAMVIPDGFLYTITNIIIGIIIISFLSKLEKRSQYFLIIFAIFINYFILSLLITLINTGNIIYYDFNLIKDYCLNACLTLIAFPFIFYIEKISGMTTAVSLIEYSNTNNKILRELSNIAPGTFQHSIQVANLAEKAARKIGANVLLTRVGSLYHDIGKMYKPNYFTENQTKNINPHDALAPEESASIIISHVKKGIELASKHHLPEDIKDFIRTHHGTRLTSYFYTKAVKQYGEENVNTDNFRYKGPKPFSRETAIVMMADSIEAVSKTLKTTDEESITTLVNNVINKQIEEQQLNNSSISLKEIEEIKRVFISSLKTSFHLRIKYPS